MARTVTRTRTRRTETAAALLTTGSAPLRSVESLADELATLRRELAELPQRIDDATETSDAELLARLLVAQRILARKIDSVTTALEHARDAELASREAQLASEVDRITDQLDQLELAANVYTRAREALYARTAPTRQELRTIRHRRIGAA